mmetsp:Transcript_215/g.581  ORF Transcript_215/g.581 Transcript_215/m.581 type:complete len:280 (-) Transcript_215:250-1089(-)
MATEASTASAATVATAHIPGHWRLIYFDAPNRGEQIRLLFHLAKQPFDDVRLKFPDGLEPYKKAAMGDDSPLLGTDKCPAVTAPDGQHKVETADIMEFLAEKFDLSPTNESSKGKAKQLALLSQEVLDKVFYKVMFPMIYKNILDKDLFGILFFVNYFTGVHKKMDEARTAFTALLDKLEGEICDGDLHFCDNQLTYADVAIFSVLEAIFQLECFDPEELMKEDCPKLFALYNNLLPKAKEVWIDERNATFQDGHESFIDYVAIKNSPLSCTRSKKGKH